MIFLKALLGFKVKRCWLVDVETRSILQELHVDILTNVYKHNGNFYYTVETVTEISGNVTMLYIYVKKNSGQNHESNDRYEGA